MIKIFGVNFEDAIDVVDEDKLFLRNVQSALGAYVPACR